MKSHDYSKEGIVRVLMERDGMSYTDATLLVRDAEEEFHNYLESGLNEYAESICEDWFGLEPDFLEAFL